MDEGIPYAEDVSYWKTGSSSPDVWIDKTRRQIEKAGGEVISEAFAAQKGHEAFLLEFILDGASFKLTWPVLPTKKGETLAARRQAATFIYHDVKARCDVVMIRGARFAFLPYLVLRGGRTAGEMEPRELERRMPALLGNEN